MKKTISAVIIFLLIFYMLFFPADAVNAAGTGLVLWYQTILPTLLPFAILSHVFIAGNLFYCLSDLLYPIVRLILPVSKEGTFPVFAGFLFGFPMGSRICTVMLSEDKISYEEASTIFAIANNMSPVFISSYILRHSLKTPQLIPLSFLALYVPAIALGRFLLSGGKKTDKQQRKKTTPGFFLNFKIMDAAIMNGFETLTKLGGYIMLFSMISSMIHHIPLKNPMIKTILIGLTEITNGIAYTTESSFDLKYKYLFCILFTAFGGLSGLAQTSSMITGSGLSMKRYLFIKLFLCAASTGIAILLYPLFL